MLLRSQVSLLAFPQIKDEANVIEMFPGSSDLAFLPSTGVRKERMPSDLSCELCVHLAVTMLPESASSQEVLRKKRPHKPQQEIPFNCYP
jgi:hypothetical protein